MPVFSIIIPNYNHARYLDQRIESVLKQTFRDFEIIILDDASSDNSRQVIEQYSGHEKISHIVYNEINSGSPFAQWQKGISMAGGEWIWIAESDDMADPAFLEEAANVFTHFPSAGLFYCDGLIRDEAQSATVNSFSSIKNQLFKTKRWSDSYVESGIKELNTYLKFDNTINNASGVVFQKKILDSILVGLENFRYYGDWFLYLQFSMVSDIFYNSRPLNIYRKHEQSFLNTPISPLTSRKEYFLILSLLYNSKDVTDKKLLLDHFCYHFLNLGLFTHSIKNSYRIVTAYFQIDRRLARKVLPRLLLAKLFRKRYKEHKVINIDYAQM